MEIEGEDFAVNCRGSKKIVCRRVKKIGGRGEVDDEDPCEEERRVRRERRVEVNPQEVMKR